MPISVFHCTGTTQESAARAQGERTHTTHARIGPTEEVEEEEEDCRDDLAGSDDDDNDKEEERQIQPEKRVVCNNPKQIGDGGRSKPKKTVWCNPKKIKIIRTDPAINGLSTNNTL